MSINAIVLIFSLGLHKTIERREGNEAIDPISTTKYVKNYLTTYLVVGGISFFNGNFENFPHPPSSLQFQLGSGCILTPKIGFISAKHPLSELQGPYWQVSKEKTRK